ncbi:endonuclease [Patescibacteria group bacterium]|nr:endonuclease [Patescibacteria group bacterium]MBU1705275.1 endonuclease [Patescibacteria group bacterium]
MKRLWIVLLGLTLLGPVLAGSSIDDFQEAKKVLFQRVYTPAQRTTFYCGCSFDSQKRVDAASCGYRVRKDAARGNRIEWEHIVPAAVFGQRLACWQNARSVCGRGGGRKCCSRTNPTFRSLEADMHNLVPAVGELNADRANYGFGLIAGEARQYGRCDFEVSNGLAEPRPEVRGNVARAYLYMNDRVQSDLGYGFLSSDQRRMYLQWHRTDPPDDWECQRHELIHRLQGNWNPYIVEGCE